MSVSNTKTIGLAEQFVQILQDNKIVLQEKGVDSSTWITNIGTLKSDAVIQSAKQNDLEAASKVQTKVAQTSVKKLYDSVSTNIDAVMGIIGKNTPAAKQIGKLRSSLIRQSKTRAEDKDKKQP